MALEFNGRLELENEMINYHRTPEQREGLRQRMTINMTGKRIGLLVVIRQDGYAKNRQAMWQCLCDCGTTTTVNGSSLRRGDVVSCGCYNRGKSKKNGKWKSKIHGMCGTPEYRLWDWAKVRARKQAISFNLQISDIIIPLYCPVLKISLKNNIKTCSDNSPTIDRINPSLGYIKGNVCVISHKANSIKRNATIGDLEKIIEYMRNGAGTALEREAI